VLRIQQGSIQIRGSLGAAMPTLDLIKMLGDSPMIENIDDTLDILHTGFKASISLSNVTLTYPDSSSPAISEINLVIEPGTSVAIVGTSGAGKTTIIDTVLGVLSPDSGQVLISNLPPIEAIAKWPGAISYVPQKIYISPGTIKQNISLGYPDELLTDELAWDFLRLVRLDEFINRSPEGLNTHLEEDGQKISGGQRQRLGIARALFTRPQILVLDEATNALDSKTEFEISESIKTLSGKVTVLVIAHRLSTIRSMDKILYLEDGKVLAFGSFNDVSTKSSSFNTFLSSIER
jgi:ABC-type multidrug transport system fused ATPase/permease subunit